ncbi:MAG: hypothetical protein LYZ70_04250 [Nitrososphaerales archaeon]|nr:hypothetical protein [Nitrososphaerales archaeon]
MSSTDEQWTRLFAQAKERLKKHDCKARQPGDLPSVDITAEEKVASTTQWVLEDDGRLEANDGLDESYKEVNFLKVECSDCQARLISGWNFRNISDGSVKNVDAPFLEDAWKVLESEYSDPIHATEDWAAIDIE